MKSKKLYNKLKKGLTKKGITDLNWAAKKPKLMIIVAIGLVLVMAIAVGCTFTGPKVEKSVTEIGDVKEAFLTVFGNYNYENRYDVWLKKHDEVGTDITIEKLRVMQEEYYACIRDYVSEEFYMTMVANREILKYEKLAYENGFSYRTDGFEFEEYSKNTDSTTYSYVVHMILTYADGAEERGTVKGQISVGDKDGLISNFYLSPTGFQPEANTMSQTTKETPTPDNPALLNLQTASDRTDPQKTAVEFLARYFESANNGGLLLHEYNSGLFEPTQSIVTAMKFLDWITLINYFLDYDIAFDMGYYSSMQNVNITNEGDITIVKGYCRTTAYGTIFEIQMQKNEAGNYVITGLDFPDSKEYINFVEAFKKSTGELDAQASPYIDEEYNRILTKCISEKKMTDEQIAVAVAKWHVKIHAVWNVAYDVDNPSTCYLTDSSDLVIFNLSRSYTIATDSPMWLVSFNTDERPVFPTYCIDAQTFECLGYIPGA